MDESRAQLIERLFDSALELEGEARSQFLDRECRGDDDLRSELAALLNHDSSARERDSFLLTPISGTLRGAALSTGEVIAGRYTLKRVLGEGGMGVVWLAEQDNPRREVALKLIRSNLAGRQLQRRFEFEASVLGRLQHPGIAQIYEAGMFDDGTGGRPFFAMEYVDGLPLHTFVKSSDLSTRERLELFALICDAVHHAHQKGVIHRDLKPGNILVRAERKMRSTESMKPGARASLRDKSLSTHHSGLPKILDFGVARATDSDIQVTTLQTDVGQLIGTLPYMSPEQVEGNAQRLDTRSDVYALGVILYELLADRLPYELSHRTIAGAARVIAEIEPTPLASLNRSFRGDLNTIVLKALEKEPAERYQSASDLSADIRRYLGDEPIAARPMSTFELGMRFARRNTALVAGIAMTFAALIAGIVGTTLGMVRAQDEAHRATAVNSFMKDLLAAADPHRGRADVTLLEVLDDASEEIPERFADLPGTEIEVRGTLTEAFFRLSRYDLAEQQAERAYELAQELFGPDDPRTLLLRHAWCMNIAFAGRNYDALTEAERMIADAPPEAYNTFAILGARRIVGFCKRKLLQLDESIEILRAVRHDAEQHLGRDHVVALSATNDLAMSLGVRASRASPEQSSADRQEAIGIYRDAIERESRVNGPASYNAVNVRLNFAGLLNSAGRHEDAILAAEEAMNLAAPLYGAQHHFVLRAHTTLADAHYRLGRSDVAVEHLEFFMNASRERGELLDQLAFGIMSDSLPVVEAAERYDLLREWTDQLIAFFSQNRSHPSPIPMSLYRLYLARCLSVEGDPAGADGLFRALEDDPAIAQNSRRSREYCIFRGEHEIAKGDLEAAGSWLAVVSGALEEQGEQAILVNRLRYEAATARLAAAQRDRAATAAERSENPIE